MTLLGRIVLASPSWLWHYFPGWLRDVGWLRGPRHMDDGPTSWHLRG